MSAKRGERILGPYPDPGGWRIIAIDAAGGRTSTIEASEPRARRLAELMRAALLREDRTIEGALVEYRVHLVDKGDRPSSIETTERAIRLMFPEPMALRSITAQRCEALYTDLRTRPSARTGAPLAADTHRNALAQSKTFLAWCFDRGWIAANPLEGVKGIGKRRPRGKSLGKAGTELRVKQAREWYSKALELATAGDQGAVGALVALLLGMRASEIVSRRVADLDSDTAPGDLLWIPCSKTAAGRRTLEVPVVLRGLLVACAAGKPPERHIFECTRPGCAPEPHGRHWVIRSVHHVCDLAGVSRVTAHGMRGLLATITAERGMAGHLIAATLGHEDERITMTAYAAPGSATAGARLRGIEILNGGPK